VTTTVLAYIPSPARGVWYLGPFPLRAYALFIIVGIVVALLIGDRRWEARGGERGVIYDISLWAVPFGLIGGRLYHVMTDWPKYFSDGGAGFIGALRIWDGGLGIWGAVALGAVGAWIACRRRGIPLPAFGDAIAPGIILAQAIGRLGNYFNQELYGRPTTLPWGLEIYERRNAAGVVSPDLANGVSTGQLDSIVHPTFLYELLWNVLVFAFLIWADRKFKLGHGRLFALYVAGYCLGRFWVELLRSDQATLIADIRINSFTSTFVFIGAVVYIMVAPKGREDPATLKGWAVDDDEGRIDEVAKELTAVGATTGVVAAAKAAGESEDEDAETVDDAPKSEAAAEAEDLAEEVAVAPDEEIEEAAEFAEKIDAANEAEAEEAEAEAVEGDADAAEELGADVAGVPADSVAEAEEFAAEGEDSESVGGVGAVEGEDAVAAEANAAEAHEAAVEGEAEAKDLADKADDAATAEHVTDGEAEAEEAGDADAVTAEGEADDAEPVGGVGAVEGEDAVAAEANAAEAHEAAVEGEAEAKDLGDKAADAEPEEADGATSEIETEDSESVGGVGAVEGNDAVAAEANVAEAHAAAVEGEAEAKNLADTAADEPDEAAEDADAVTAEGEADDAEPVGGVGAVEGDDAVAAEATAAEAHEAAVEGEAEAKDLADKADNARSTSEAEDVPASASPPSFNAESGGRIRRLLRRRNR
jgi:prolipoprotein diacylglyceryl transferase